MVVVTNKLNFDLAAVHVLKMSRFCYVCSKVIGNAYEEYLLSVGDFDERIFLGKDAAVEMGTPVKAGVSYVGELSERMQATRNLREHFEEVGVLLVDCHV